jgi:AbrB family looped-hinge helix DNA binding protein
MASATVTSKGQITIPIEVRKELSLKPGDRIEFYKSGYGPYTIIAKNQSVQRLKGMFGKFPRVVSVEEMNEAIEQEAAGLPGPDNEVEES